jgi:hypothetical protein
MEHPFPDVPTEHGEQILYWEGAMYVLTMALGWTDPGLGLKRWMDAGRPDQEPLLYLLKRVWDHAGQLERLAAWLWLSDGEKSARTIRQLPGATTSRAWGRLHWKPDPSFGTEVEHRWASRGGALPFKQPIGSNELHLGHVLWMAHPGGPAGHLCGVDHASGRAVIVIDTVSHWYGSFYQTATALPDLVDRSWKVDLLVRNWGWLGTYRRSRETGLWFLGRHATHMLGN